MTLGFVLIHHWMFFCVGPSHIKQHRFNTWITEIKGISQCHFISKGNLIDIEDIKPQSHYLNLIMELPVLRWHIYIEIGTTHHVWYYQCLPNYFWTCQTLADVIHDFIIVINDRASYISQMTPEKWPYLMLFSHSYTPRTTKLLGGYTGFTPSVRPSRMPCPLCIIYSYGWIVFILGTNDHYHERVCRAPWPLTLTYIFKHGSHRPWKVLEFECCLEKCLIFQSALKIVNFPWKVLENYFLWPWKIRDSET